MAKEKDITGIKFGKVVALGRSVFIGVKNRWVFECECGNKFSSRKHNVTSGETASCGCYAKEQRLKGVKTHGLSRTKFYRVWCSMRRRCNDPNVSEYKNYGGRGIKVCERWLDFNNFYDDMYSSYKEGLTLERTDNEKGYCKENCKWITHKEQHSNKRTTRLVTLDGETLCFRDTCKKFRINEGIAYSKLRKGMSYKQIFIMKENA